MFRATSIGTRAARTCASRFTGLRHHTIICCDHQDGNIRSLGATSPHCGKRCMARCIQKGDGTILMHNLISTNVLGNPTRFTTGNISLPDGIQQAGFP